MGFFKELYDDEIKEMFPDELGGLAVSVVGKGDSKTTNWGFTIQGDFPNCGRTIEMAAKTGRAKFCKCSYCKRLGDEVAEHYAVLQALAYIRETYPYVPVELNVRSNGLAFLAKDGFYGYHGLSDCVSFCLLVEQLCGIAFEMQENLTVTREDVTLNEECEKK